MRRRIAIPAFWCFAALAALLPLAPQISRAQQNQPARDVVANFAAGRVEICAAKDTIVLATADEPFEAGSTPPQIFQLGTGRIGVLLGAVEWIEPGSGAPPDRFASDLTDIGREAPTDANAGAGNEATDIETLGIALLERIRAQAEGIHHKIDLAADEPLVELIVADYLPDYGFEAWEVRYNITQEAMGNDYWVTRVSRPNYTQLYPPEKGQPRTLIEVSYPPEATRPTLVDQLRRNDPSLAAARSASPQLARATTQLVDGESTKSIASDDADFLRAAMPIVTRPEARLALVEITDTRDVVWVLGAPAPTQAAAPAPGQPQSDPDAPSLYKH